MAADSDPPPVVDVPDLLRRAATADARWLAAFGPDAVAAARTLAAALGSPDWKRVLEELGLVRRVCLDAVDELVADDPRSQLARDVDDAVDVAPGSRDRAARAVAAWLGVPVAHDLTYRR